MVNRYGLGYSAPVVETTEGAKAMVDALLGSDKEAKTKAFAQIDLALRAPFDERFGKSNDILKRVIDHAQKSNTLLPVAAILMRIAQNDAGDIRQLDDQWKTSHQQYDLTNGVSGMIAHILNVFEMHQVADEESEITYSASAQAVWEGVVADHFKGGVKISDTALRLDPFQKINDIVARMRYGSMKKENMVMWANILAAIVAASTATYVSAFSATIANTFNTAREVLFDRLAATSTPMADTAEVVLYTNTRNKAAVNAAFRLVNAESYGTLRTEWNAEVKYTRNLSVDFGLGGAAKAVLVAKNHVANAQGIFMPPTIKTKREDMENHTKFGAYQAFTGISDEISFQVFNLS